MFSIQAQRTIAPPSPQDSIPSLDNISTEQDTIPKNTPKNQPPNLPVSDQGLDQVVDYGAKGPNSSERIEAKTQKIHLKGEAYVKYPGYEIQAGYIIFDLKNSEAYAEAIQDSLGNEIGVPVFITNGQEIKYKKLKYNFDTNQGIVYDAISRQGELFVHGGLTKFVSKDSDSLVFDDQIFNKDALITSCNHEHPHYGIRTSKLKIIPDKLAVLGPARLEIAGIPTPIFIPFALLPLFTDFNGGRSGIVFGGQRGIEFSAELGLGFREIGYHFAINDYVDFRITGDIYTRGSWAIRTKSNYAKRYKYRGALELGYSRRFIETVGVLEPGVESSFSFRLSHNQDPKAHPYIKLGGNINFTTNNYDQRNFNDAAPVLRNTINSNFNFSHSLPSLPALSLSANFGHSQNTQTNSITFTLPDLQLRMKTIYPFKRKNSSGSEKWYEKINIQGNSKWKNYLNTIDTTLFTASTLDSIQTGFSHDATMSASFNVMKYFTFTPRVTYDEVWFFKSRERTFDPNTIITFDTLSVDTIFNSIDTNDFFVNVDQDTIYEYGRINSELVNGFKTFRDLNVGFDLATNLFGTIQFKKGRLRGLRHTMKPKIGFNFRPDTEKYLEFVPFDNRDTTMLEEYNPFVNGVYRRPSLTGRQMAITYGLQNVFEGKYFSKKDSTDKKFKIFNSINFTGSYNFAADSLKWSEVSMRGSARFFKGITNLTISATFDPYMEKDNRRVNTTVWSERNRFLRFEEFRTTLTTNFTINKIREILTGERPKTRKKSSAMDDDLIDIFSQFTISHSINFTIEQNDGVNEFEMKSHSIRSSGSFPLTEKWDVSIGNFSYDLKNKRFVYPDLGLVRDLHCWTMRFGWQPQRGTYSFFIGVNTSELSSVLKYNYGVNQYNTFY